MPRNQPLGNNAALVELDAQNSEVNRALSAIRITQASDFALIAEGLSAILENGQLPDSISDDAMKAGLNNIQAFFNEPCEWVGDQANKQAFYNLATEIIVERIALYRLLAQTDQRRAAERYIQAENDRRAEAQTAQAAQERLRNARRTYRPRPRNLIEALGLSRSRENGLIVIAVAMMLAIIAAFVLTLLFATWIGGSILADAGWKGVFTAHQLVNFSMSVTGSYAFIDLAWTLYTYFRRPPETRGEFLGYNGIKATALKYGLFFIAASLLQPLMMGVMNGAVYGFSLASVAIGLPLALAGFAVATYFIAVNVAALFAVPIVAIELSSNAAMSDNLNNADQGMQDMPGLVIFNESETEPPQALVGSNVGTQAPLLLTQSIQPQPQVQQEERPLTREELRAARLKHFAKMQ